MKTLKKACVYSDWEYRWWDYLQRKLPTITSWETQQLKNDRRLFYPRQQSPLTWKRCEAIRNPKVLEIRERLYREMVRLTKQLMWEYMDWQHYVPYHTIIQTRWGTTLNVHPSSQPTLEKENPPTPQPNTVYNTNSTVLPFYYLRPSYGKLLRWEMNNVKDATRIYYTNMKYEQWKNRVLFELKPTNMHPTYTNKYLAYLKSTSTNWTRATYKEEAYHINTNPDRPTANEMRVYHSPSDRESIDKLFSVRQIPAKYLRNKKRYRENNITVSKPDFVDINPNTALLRPQNLPPVHRLQRAIHNLQTQPNNPLLNLPYDDNWDFVDKKLYTSIGDI